MVQDSKSRVSDELLAELIAIYDEDQELVVALRELQERRAAPEREARQRTVHNWCVAAFGEGAASSLPQRGIRLLEEVLEACQAAEVDPAMAHKLIDFVYSRPIGELAQEIGSSGLTLLALAQAAGVDANAEEAREVARVLAKPSSHWAARNASKNAAGFDTALAQPKVK